MQTVATVSLEETPNGASPAISSLPVASITAPTASTVVGVVVSVLGKLQGLSIIIGLALLLIIPGCGQPI